MTTSLSEKTLAPLPMGKLQAHLLDRLLKKLPITDHKLIIPPGIGNDAAGLEIGNQLIAITTDPITFTTQQIGTYSIAVNINDLACLGCKPQWYSGVLLLPPGITEYQLELLWDDLCIALSRYNIQAIGGHTEVTATVNTPVLIGQMIGTVIGKNLLDLRQACAGDEILLIGHIAVEGSAILAQKRYHDLLPYYHDIELKAMQNFLENPGICVWPWVEKIVPHEGLVGFHDPTEGGIATALHELADTTGCGILISEPIPLLPETQKLCKLLSINPLGLLSSGALLAVCKPTATKQLLRRLSSVPAKLIGKLTTNSERLLTSSGHYLKLPRYSCDEIVPGLTQPLNNNQ